MCPLHLCVAGGREDMIPEQLLASIRLLSCEAHSHRSQAPWEGGSAGKPPLCRVKLPDTSELPEGPRDLCCTYRHSQPPAVTRLGVLLSCCPELLPRERQTMEATAEALTGLLFAVSHSSETDPKRHKVQTHRNTGKHPSGSGSAAHPGLQTEALLGGDT